MYWFNICTAYTVYVISDSALTDAMQIAESDSALSLVYYKLNIFYFILFYVCARTTDLPSNSTFILTFK